MSFASIRLSSYWSKTFPIQAILKNGHFVPLEALPADWPDGQRVEITVNSCVGLLDPVQWLLDLKKPKLIEFEEYQTVDEALADMERLEKAGCRFVERLMSWDRRKPIADCCDIFR